MISERTERIIVMERLDLYNNHGRPCGPKAIQRLLTEESLDDPLPSTSTIARVLRKHCLTHGRTGWYEGEDPNWTPASGKSL